VAELKNWNAKTVATGEADRALHLSELSADNVLGKTKKVASDLFWPSTSWYEEKN
jgi:hypothetical protein